MTRLSEDDGEAFTLIYHHYWDDLLISAAKVLREKDVAADVVQDVFLSLWNRRKEIDIKESIEAYLHTSVRYKAIHYIEKNITRDDYLQSLMDEIKISEESSLVYYVEQKETLQRLDEAVQKLPSRMQEVYFLSREENLNYKQIADKLGISSETVKKQIKNALKHIKVALKNFPTSFFLLISFFGILP